MTNAHTFMKSPVGTLTLIAGNGGLCAVLWENDAPNRVRLDKGAHDSGHAVLVAAQEQLAQYFAGERRTFDLALDFNGTPFQRAVWQALLDIPYGQTRSYSDVARAIGNPAAVRAVGAANGRNPLSIIAPCHRVIGAAGALTGFAGGLAAKQFLLKLEASR